MKEKEQSGGSISGHGCPSAQYNKVALDWEESFEKEFGIHFKASGELQFVKEFIKELLEKEREKCGSELL